MYFGNLVEQYVYNQQYIKTQMEQKITQNAKFCCELLHIGAFGSECLYFLIQNPKNYSNL
jgi:hypothetical protein